MREEKAVARAKNDFISSAEVSCLRPSTELCVCNSLFYTQKCHSQCSIASFLQSVSVCRISNCLGNKPAEKPRPNDINVAHEHLFEVRHDKSLQMILALIFLDISRAHPHSKPGTNFQARSLVHTEKHRRCQRLQARLKRGDVR